MNKELIEQLRTLRVSDVSRGLVTVERAEELFLAAADALALAVPLEPTESMLRCGRSAMKKRHKRLGELSAPMNAVRMIYKAMLAAAFVDQGVNASTERATRFYEDGMPS